MTIPCISLWQPWASLVVAGVKRNETRCWRVPTRYIGHRVAIHAAKSREGLRDLAQAADMGYPTFNRFLAQAEVGLSDLPFGAILGTAEVADCLPTCIPDPGEPRHWLLNPALALTDDERILGNYAPERFAWVLLNPVKLANPVAYRGAQGFFDVPAEVLRA